jgi:hypothetical protein
MDKSCYHLRRIAYSLSLGLGFLDRFSIFPLRLTPAVVGDVVERVAALGTAGTSES